MRESLLLTFLAVSLVGGCGFGEENLLVDPSFERTNESSSEDVEVDHSMRPSRKAARMRWAALIQRVFEVDPLKCQHCGGAMRIIAFIERKDQPQVVERILKHCGLWNPRGSRTPPTDEGSDEGNREFTYTPIEEEWLEELEQLAVSS